MVQTHGSRGIKAGTYYNSRIGRRAAIFYLTGASLENSCLPPPHVTGSNYRHRRGGSCTLPSKIRRGEREAIRHGARSAMASPTSRDSLALVTGS